MANGIATINLPTAALADSVLVNKDGDTSIIPVSDLATQLAASGGIADALAQVEAQVTSGLLKLSTWAALMAKAPSEDGTGGEVIETDTGSHNGASATGYDGTVVDNHGRYNWVSAWGRWARIGDVVAYATAAQGAKADTAVQPGDITGSEPSKLVPGVFLNAPYYEFDGNTLYVKPAVFSSGNVAYIRGGYLANESFTYSQIKADLGAQSTPSGCALDATSPLGVTDCIQLGATSTLYYDPETGSWGWSTRTGQQTGYVKVLETNYGTIGNCTEQGVALAQLSGSESGGIVALRANQPCTYITSRYGDYVPDFDPVARTLLIPNDLIFRIEGESYVVKDEVLIPLHSTNTISVVYLDLAASTITAAGSAYRLDPPVFVVREYNDDWGGLSAVDSENLILISISRITSGAYSGNSEITIGGPYRISGNRYGVDIPAKNEVQIMHRENSVLSSVERIAHRGGLWLGPENTIAAIKASYQSGIFDSVEGDIRFTSDDVPMSYCQIWCLRIVGHAAIWSGFVASIPSLNVTPVMTLAR